MIFGVMHLKILIIYIKKMIYRVMNIENGGLLNFVKGCLLTDICKPGAI